METTVKNTDYLAEEMAIHLIYSDFKDAFRQGNKNELLT